MEAESGMGLSTMARWTDKEAEKVGLLIGYASQPFSHASSRSGRNAAQAEKTTRYFVWRDIVTELVDAIEQMPENQTRVKNLNESRTPVFLMTLKEDKGNSKIILKSYDSEERKSNNRSALNTGALPAKKVLKPARKGESSVGVSSREKQKMQSSASAVPQVGTKKKVAISRTARGGTVDEKTPPLLSSGSQDFNAPKNYFPAQHQAIAQKKWAILEERLRKAFSKAGEAPSQTALMNLIYPYEFTQSEVYGKLQGKFRINELTDLIRRLVNEICEWKPLVITVHNSQWIDQLSWELLWEICNACPKLMICLFSRPEKYYESIEARIQYQKFKRYAQADFMNLQGLSAQEMEQLIVMNWISTPPARSVSKNIIENIQKRTAGNPLYIKSALVALKESGKFAVDATTNELSLNSKEFDFEKSISLVDNLQSVITSQLDRLDASFQLFLKMAAVLGQTFVLEDILNLLEDTQVFSDLVSGVEVCGTEDMNDQIISKIKAMDKYEYLERVENVEMGDQFTFKSSFVRDCIYNMMLQTQRQQLHLNIAVYYESTINASNQHRLLLALYEHYSNTDEIHMMKRLTYLEIMAHLYFERNSIGEAIKHYSLLIELAAKTSKSVAITFDNISKSTWHRELGEAYYTRGDEMQAENHLFASLRLVGSKLPTNWMILALKTTKEKKIRCTWPILLAGEVDLTSALSQSPDLGIEANLSHESLSFEDEFGLKNFDATKNIITEEMQFDPMAVQLAEMILKKDNARLHNIRRAMACLGILYLNTGRYQESIYAINVATNISELFPRDALYAKLMAVCGLLCWMESGRKRDTLRYLESANKHDQRYDLVQTVYIVLKSAQTFFLMGKWGSAIRRLGLLPALEMMSGDFLLRLDALRMRSVIIHMCGARPQSLKAAKALYMISKQENNWEGELWGCELILANFLNIVKSSAEVPEYGKKLKILWNARSDRVKNDPTLNLNYLALVARAELCGDPQAFNLEEFLKEMVRHTTNLLKPAPKKFSESISNARGGESNSAGGPHECLALIGVLHSAQAFLTLWDFKLINKPHHIRMVGKVVKNITTWLKNGSVMRYMAIAEPVRLLYEGIGLQITRKNGAVKVWKRGLVCRRVSDLMYVRGLLHLSIACYTDNSSNSNHNAHEAQKLFSRIGSTVEFERAKAFRKDRKDRTKGDTGSGVSEVKELDDNYGDSIFDESKSYGDRSFGDQSSTDAA